MTSEDSSPRRRTAYQFALVGAGGAIGTGSRFLCGLLTDPGTGMLAIFAINVVGAFLLGALLEACGTSRQNLRLFLGTGVLGGFTTYSTLSVNTALLLENRSALLATAYGVGTIVLGGIATYGGILAAQTLFQRKESSQ